MKTFIFLTCLIALNLNCQEMTDTNQDCFDIENFRILKTYIIENDSEIKLSERLVADKEIDAMELSTEDKYIELVENSTFDEIIIIDKNASIPPYSCRIDGDHLKFSAYESRFDTDADIEARRNDWCQLITTLDTVE